MKIVVDECCPSYIVRELRSDNHDVIYVAEDAPSLKDNDILSWAFREELLPKIEIFVSWYFSTNGLPVGSF